MIQSNTTNIARTDAPPASQHREHVQVARSLERLPTEVWDVVLQPSLVHQRDIIALSHVSRKFRCTVFGVLSHQLKVKVGALQRGGGEKRHLVPQDAWLKLSRDFNLLVCMANNDMGSRLRPSLWARYGVGVQEAVLDLTRCFTKSWDSMSDYRDLSRAGATALPVCEGTADLSFQDVLSSQAGVPYRTHAAEFHHRGRVADLADVGSALQSLGPDRLRAQMQRWVHGEEYLSRNRNARYVVEKCATVYATGASVIGLEGLELSSLPSTLTSLVSLQELYVGLNPCTQSRPLQLFRAMPNLVRVSWGDRVETVTDGVFILEDIERPFFL